MNFDAFNYGPIVIFRWKNEPNWPVLEVSQNAGQVLGYADKQFLTSQVSYSEIIHPHDLAQVMEEVTTYSEKGNLHFHHKPYRIIKSNGEVIWVDDYTTVIRNENNEITEYIGYIIDSTQRIKDETELREIKDRYDAILAATDEGVWDWDIRTNSVYFSSRWKSMLGHQDDEISTAYDEWESRVHPEDLEQCYIEVDKHLNAKTDNFSYIHRMKHKQGHYIWVQEQGKCVFNEHGKAYRMIGIQKDITHEIKLKTELETLAISDALTHLLNRTEFDRLARIEIERAKRYQTTCSFMMLDLDDFKEANDTYGHQAGDEILIRLSQLLKEMLRSSDIIARYGGEEFIILLPETDCHKAELLGERIRIELEKMEFHFTTMNQTPQTQIHKQTVSIGVANHLEDASLEQTIHFTDKALYKAKLSGKNQTYCWCQTR